jgi:hypothetical protein
MTKEKQFEITIMADTNDGDYVTQISKISEFHLEKLKPLIKAIKNFKPYTTPIPQGDEGREWEHCHNYTTGDATREDLGEKSGYDYYLPTFGENLMQMWEELLPCDERGIHTIVCVEVTPYVKKTRLL